MPFRVGEATIRKVGINSGGYTSSGKYYGIGQPVFEYDVEEVPLSMIRNKDFYYWGSDESAPYEANGEMCVTMYGSVRADNMKEAKEKLKKMYPGIYFSKKLVCFRQSY